MKLNQGDLQRLVELRHEIHQHPELSGKEEATPHRILKFLRDSPPDVVLNDIGGEGMILIYDSGKKGPNLLFRCELDALPIDEINSISYRSKYSDVAHVCGHDGHMAIITGLGLIFGKQKPPAGKIILLYQPAEETGEGAFKMMQDEVLKDLKVDLGFAQHNLPGYKKGQIVLSENIFAAASRGITIHLEGKTSHAAEPEHGINPAQAVSAIINAFNQLHQQSDLFEDFVLITPIHIQLGSIAFGTSAGKAEMRFTLRAFRDVDMQKLMHEAEEIIKRIALKERLKFDFEYNEIFPTTRNHPEALKYLHKSAEQLGLNYIYKKTPFRWSEDFGQFKSRFKTSFFGIGAGENQPDLHNPDYDFPDELIQMGITFFYQIAEEVWKAYNLN